MHYVELLINYVYNLGMGDHFILVIGLIRIIVVRVGWGMTLMLIINIWIVKMGM